MEPLPSGANFVRAKWLWEIGLHIAGDPKEPYTGNRDVCISVGSGSSEHYRPWLRMSSGSSILAHAVAHGELEMAIVNPSAMLTQAHRGTGLFAKPLPVRIIASYPSWDRFVFAIHPRTGVTSLAQVKERRLPLRISVREDMTHSSHVLIAQTLELYGFTLNDVVSWGGSLQLNGPPMDKRRLEAMRNGTVDAVFDEGIIGWLDHALEAGMKPIAVEDTVLGKLQAIGWRKSVLPAKVHPRLGADHVCIDFSGWPLYANASLPDDVAYKACAAIHARIDEIQWDDQPWAPFGGMGALGQETEATPRDVPLHPGAEKWYREHGFPV